jgi:dsRNA-specific ribonuclease
MCQVSNVSSSIGEIHPNVGKAEELTGIVFDDKRLLQQALTHRSAVQDSLDCNNRLCFVGTEALRYIVAERMYHLTENPDSSLRKKYGVNEGALSEATTHFTSTEVTGGAAQRIGLPEVLIVGDERLRKNHIKVFSESFRAVVAAVMLDKGLDMTKEKVGSWLIKPRMHKEKGGGEDSRHKLERLAREALGAGNLRCVECPEGHPLSIPSCPVVVDLFFGNNYLASGRGESQKAAKKNAINNALQNRTEWGGNK